MAYEPFKVGQERADDEEQRGQRRRDARTLPDDYSHTADEQSEHHRSQVQIPVQALTHPSQRGREPRAGYALPACAAAVS